ncbi:hypothetical protein MRB53_027479 [Persea americana]|uniref:Uncharacterized protein n=1 Tax=Persea americana TaxID=3435 RepID=A0ACC2LLR7_PERAE|nr:hypothetical protein MRB53_027479 [Persea americana]
MSGRKETVLDLAKFVDKGVQVKLTGGRQVTGTLKGYDQLLNLVLDEAIEFLRDPDDPLKTTDQTRQLGLIVCRGTAVMLVSPTDGTDELPTNPFIQPDAADVLVEALEWAGANVFNAYPGSASVEIHLALSLSRSHTISNVLCRHEEEEIFAAEGYARSSGCPGVCIATSGPGATNLYVASLCAT